MTVKTHVGGQTAIKGYVAGKHKHAFKPIVSCHSHSSDQLQHVYLSGALQVERKTGSEGSVYTVLFLAIRNTFGCTSELL